MNTGDDDARLRIGPWVPSQRPHGRGAGGASPPAAPGEGTPPIASNADLGGFGAIDPSGLNGVDASRVDAPERDRIDAPEDVHAFRPDDAGAFGPADAGERPHRRAFPGPSMRHAASPPGEPAPGGRHESIGMPDPVVPRVETPIRAGRRLGLGNLANGAIPVREPAPPLPPPGRDPVHGLADPPIPDDLPPLPPPGLDDVPALREDTALDGLSPVGDDEPDVYLGHRRGERSLGRWALIGSVVAALTAAAITLPLALRSDPPREPQANAGAATSLDESTAPAAPVAQPQPSVSVASPSPSESQPPSPSATSPTTRSVTYEAEAAQNVLSGSATVTAWPGASGGRLVQNLGAWGPALKKQGSMTFTRVNVPAEGRYTLVMYTVDTDGEPTRTAQISVAGSATLTIKVTSGTNCCSARTFELNLRKGDNSITIASSDGRAPSIDRLVITIPQGG